MSFQMRTLCVCFAFHPPYSLLRERNVCERGILSLTSFPQLNPYGVKKIHEHDVQT